MNSEKQSSAITTSRILVTGGAGFIGSHLTDYLLAQGAEVIVIDNLSTGNISNLNSDANFIEADLNTHNLDHLLNKIDFVFFM